MLYEIASLRRVKFLFSLVMCLVMMATLQPLMATEKGNAAPAAETKELRDARMKWWREARFGMFIHWGLYALPAGTWKGKQIPDLGEWLMFYARVSVDEYAGLAKQFNPFMFDAEKWVLTAKNAGMKYIIITSKHHDGFAMFHSEASKYNIYDATPFKRDPIEELAKACKKHGIRLGFYYSQAQDWHHPGGGVRDGAWDPAQKGNKDDYINNVVTKQVTELLTKYGKISVLWWDTPMDMNREQILKVGALTKLQPGIITNDRLGGTPGDLSTPEGYIPACGIPDRDWETCMTVNGTWGYKSYENNWESTENLVRNLIDIASKGGNYLLNVGPTAEGLFPEPIVDRFKGMGEWMKINGESIYATTASPFNQQLQWGRCTRKGSKLYLHVFNWPTDGVLTVPLQNEAKRAYLLTARKKALSCTSDGENIKINLPTVAPDKTATVVILELKGEPKVAKLTTRAVADAPATLQASRSRLHGNWIMLETISDKQSIGRWNDMVDFIDWDVQFDKAGTYEVTAEYAVPQESAGSVASLECGNEKLEFKVESTSGWSDFVVRNCGRIKIPAAGEQIITLKPISKPGPSVFNFRCITLTPVTE